MNDTFQLIGPFENRLREELEIMLCAFGWQGVDVMVLQTSPDNAMIQIIYPFGYTSARDNASVPTIFSAIEDFILDKLKTQYWGFILRDTHLRVWITKNSSASEMLMRLPDAFAT